MVENPVDNPDSHERSHKEWALACLNGNVRALLANGTKTQADVDAWGLRTSARR